MIIVAKLYIYNVHNMLVKTVIFITLGTNLSAWRRHSQSIIMWQIYKHTMLRCTQPAYNLNVQAVGHYEVGVDCVN